MSERAGGAPDRHSWLLAVRGLQDACGAQPLVCLFEGHSLRFGAAIVDVQAASITFAAWQAGGQGLEAGEWVGGPGA